MGEKIRQSQILTGPKLVTPSNADDMLAQENWSVTSFREYSNKFSVITGRQVYIPCLYFDLSRIFMFLYADLGQRFVLFYL